MTAIVHSHTNTIYEQHEQMKEQAMDITKLAMPPSTTAIMHFILYFISPQYSRHISHKRRHSKIDNNHHIDTSHPVMAWLMLILHCTHATEQARCVAGNSSPRGGRTPRTACSSLVTPTALLEARWSVSEEICTSKEGRSYTHPSH